MNICHEIAAFTHLRKPHLSQPVFVRLDIAQKYEAVPEVNCAEQIMPILFLPAATQKNVVEAHRDYARQLKADGFKKCVIAADEDGAVQKSLSPRYSPGSIDERMNAIMEVFAHVQAIMDEVWVLLTVEELAPGGIDATDGVAIARALASRGLKTIIATAGTKDFMPLYDRRVTQKKDPSSQDFYSNEPALASSLWLLKNTDLSVWCLAFLDDDHQALTLAKTIGLAGLIKKEKYDQI